MFKKLILLVGILLLNTTFLLSQSKYSIKDTLVDGNSVHMKINNKTGAIHRIYGLKNFVKENEKITEQNIKDLSEEFLEKNKELLKIVPKDLKLMRSENRKKKWHVSYRQYYKNIPIHHSYLEYTVHENGNIIALGSYTHPKVELDINPNINESEAFEIAEKRFEELSKIEKPKIRKKPELIVLPVETDDRYDYYLAYNIELDFIDTTHVFSQAYFINAFNGQIIKEFSNIINEGKISTNIKMAETLYGTVKLRYYPEHYNDSTVEYSNWNGGIVALYDYLDQYVGSQTTNSSGYYCFTGLSYSNYTVSSNISSTNLSNSYVRIYNMNQSHYSGVYPGEHNWNWAGDECNVFYHVDWIHDFYKSSPFSYNGMDYQTKAYVHQGSDDNGWSDGIDIGFGSEDDYYWARSSDVVYHEYTHSTIYHLYGNRFIGDLEDYSREDWAMDEGLADYFAISINNDATQGESVGVNRNHSVNYTMAQFGNIPGFPDDPQGAHLNGMIIGGACWDLREDAELSTSYVNELVFDALQMTPHAYTFEDFAENIAIADDDDGNLNNSVPHYYNIKEAFETNHGIDFNVPAPIPSPPQNLNLSGDYGDNPYLTWNSSQGATSYKVYRQQFYDNPTSLSLIGTTSNTYYTDNEIEITSKDNRDDGYRYRVTAVNSEGESDYSQYVDTWGTMFKGVNDQNNIVHQDESMLPEEFSLMQNYPNPFNPITTINYQIPEYAHVVISIYNLRGELVARLIDAQRNAGYHKITWDASHQPCGIYICKMEAANFTAIKKLTLLK